MAKFKQAGPRRKTAKRIYAVGQAVWAITQGDGTVLTEIIAIDRTATSSIGPVFTVRSKAGKTYRILSSEIV